VEEKKKHKDVELRSEEVQEVMGQIPSWILRWGITILFLVVFTILIVSCFFKYPDVIVTEMTLTSQQPAVQLVARSSGKLNYLYVKDGDKVQSNQLLSVIENPASVEDILYLKEKLPHILNHPDNMLIYLSSLDGNKNKRSNELSLGDVQSIYTSFLSSCHEYKNYTDLNYFPKKIASTKGQINKYRSYYQSLEQQQRMMEAQHRIANQQYARDSLLFERQILSPSEHESARSTLLQSQYSLEGTNASLENLKIQIGQLEETLLDLELQQQEKESVLLQNYKTSIEQLINAINGWELNYCLYSPIEGIVTFTKYWNENQYVITGDDVFTIVPSKEQELLGKALLPAQRSGKVKTGQRAIIRFTNYPDQEFGIVDGKVSSISLVPSENNYMVEITFPNGLTTNYGKLLPVSHEMKASAEIVTEDLRLIERFFMPVKKVWKEGFN